MSFPLGRLDLGSAETREDVRNMVYRLVVRAPFQWKSNVEPLTQVDVPEGFKTDGGSVPRFFWRVLGGPNGPYREAYIPHDLLYSQAGMNARTRLQADNALKEIILELGGRAWQAWLVWLGVRLGGWIPWGKHKKRNTAGG